MKVNIYLPHTFKTSYDADVIVGVDYGAFLLADKDIAMDYAIGDFDSTSVKEFKLVKKYCNNIIKLNINKDETDSEAAIMHLKDLGYSDITLIGDTGHRLDHFLINYRLVEKYNVTYILKNSKIFTLEKGYHKIQDDYQFLSLFTSSSTTFSISGTKYEVCNTKIEYFDTYTSANEIVSNYANIEVLSGKLTVVLSNDK